MDKTCDNEMMLQEVGFLFTLDINCCSNFETAMKV